MSTATRPKKLPPAAEKVSATLIGHRNVAILRKIVRDLGRYKEWCAGCSNVLALSELTGNAEPVPGKKSSTDPVFTRKCAEAIQGYFAVANWLTFRMSPQHASDFTTRIERVTGLARQVDNPADRTPRSVAAVELGVEIGLLQDYLANLSCEIESQRKAPEKAINEIGDDAHLSYAKLAEHFKVPPEPLRKRLDRFRKTHDAGWIENTERGTHGTRYLYRVGDVRPIIGALSASGETSGERPAKNNHVS
jgi:hypothetical protein